MLVALIGRVAEEAYLGVDRAHGVPAADDEDEPRARRSAESLSCCVLETDELLAAAEAAAERVVADAGFEAAVLAFAAVLVDAPHGLDPASAAAEVEWAAREAGLEPGSLPRRARAWARARESHPPTWRLEGEAGHELGAREAWRLGREER
jgi:hypothetical protein